MNVVPLPVHDAAPADTAPGAGPRLAIEIRGLAKTYAGRGKSPPRSPSRVSIWKCRAALFSGFWAPMGPENRP